MPSLLQREAHPIAREHRRRTARLAARADDGRLGTCEDRSDGNFGASACLRDEWLLARRSSADFGRIRVSLTDLVECDGAKAQNCHNPHRIPFVGRDQVGDEKQEKVEGVQQNQQPATAAHTRKSVKAISTQ